MNGYVPSPYLYVTAANNLARQNEKTQLVFALVAAISIGAMLYCANRSMDTSRGRSL